MKKNKKCRIKRTGLAAVLACAVLLGKGPIWNVQAEGTAFVHEAHLQEAELSDENGYEVWFEDEDENLPENEAGTSEEALSAQELQDDVQTEVLGEANNGEENVEDPGQERDGEKTEQEDTEGEDPQATDQGDTGGEESENPNQEIPEGDLEAPEQNESENLQDIPEADFILRAEAQKETARAGEELLYKITAENTGDLSLEKLSFKSSFGEKGLVGVWENQAGEPLSGENSGILEAGQSRSFYLSVPLLEDRTEPVTLDLTADAWYYPEMVSDDEPELQVEPAVLSRVLSVNTPIMALKTDFMVTKTADRTMAVPGDRVLFQICIQNTGERTLHSILTTEKFQLEGVPVEFLEKEGVTLNKSKTRALISKLEPDSSFSLQAVVQLPENVKEQELINEVEVITAETGSRVVASRASVQICTPDPTDPPPEILAEEAPDPATRVRPVSDNPKTGDASPLEIWLCILVIAFLIAVFLYIWYFGSDISDHIKKRTPPSEENR